MGPSSSVHFPAQLLGQAPSLPFSFFSSSLPQRHPALAEVQSVRTSVFLCTFACITALQKCLSHLLGLVKFSKFSISSLVGIFFGLLGFTSGCLGNQHTILDRFQQAFQGRPGKSLEKWQSVGPSSLRATWNPVYQLQGTRVSPLAEHLPTPEGFICASAPSPARGASEVMMTGETGHGHKPGAINEERGLLAFPRCGPLEPASPHPPTQDPLGCLTCTIVPASHF